MINLTKQRARFAAAAIGAMLCALSAAPAGAQTPLEAGVNALPLVTILYDNSGSMEWRDDDADHTYPDCVADGTNAPGDGSSRHHAAIEVLTGTVPDRYCAIDQRDQDVTRIDQVDPTRSQGIRHSRLCTRAGGTGALVDHAAECTPATLADPVPDLNQVDNGLIDEFSGLIGFGLMAFDSFEEPSNCADGMFSYGESRSMPSLGGGIPDPRFPGSPMSCAANPGGVCWNLGARAPYEDVVGPVNCADGSVIQGASIPPLDPSGGLEQAAINTLVQDEIVRLIPYWSTPLGAMLEDAYNLYIEDPIYYSWRAEPQSGDYSRGFTDPFSECRRRYVLLITDGIPSFGQCVRTGDTLSNDPWLPGCENYPYADAPYYARQLYDAGVQVFVVGFNIPDTAESVLNEIALAGSGGEEEARFAGSGQALVFELGDIFSQIASGTPSRTTPANATRIHAGAGGRGQFTFEASFEIHKGSPYWTGNLDRISQFCEDGELSEPLRQSMTDWLDGRTLSQLEDLEILTTSPEWHSCALASSTGDAETSLFHTSINDGGNPLLSSYGVTGSEIAAACQVGEPPGSSTVVSTACQDLARGDVGFDDSLSAVAPSTRCMSALDTSTARSYHHLLGGLSPDQGELFQRWLRGFSLTDIRLSTGLLEELRDVLPTAEFRWDDTLQLYTNDRASRVGAIYHSSPAVVTVPDARLLLGPGYDTFVASTASRPTAVYVATTDGLIRGFNADNFEELFAFLPSSIAHRVGSNMRSHTTLFDGSPVAADVRVFRDASGNDEWMTVLLVPGRGGARSIVALDVTDPETPSFLWELDSELDPQFGLAFSEPDIGTIFLAECDGPGSPACERSVAIFGGGAPSSGLTGWESTNIGRTIYVVDVATGYVYRRFTHMYDLTGDEVPISAPVTGDAAAFDTFGGSIVNRAFLGTLDGRLLRVDMQESDPSEWQVDLFFDPVEQLDSDIDVGGIFFRPTIALRRDSSRAVVVFGTGNLDELDTVDASDNVVVSLTERPIFNMAGVFQRMEGALNFAVELEDNERMTARPRIFNRRAYFATFVPNANLCEIGGARLYALDFIGPEIGYHGTIDTVNFKSYLREDPHDPDQVSNANPAVPFHDAASYLNSSFEGPTVIPPKSIIYSLNVVEKVTCFEETSIEGTRGGTQSVILNVTDQGEYVLQVGASTLVENETTGIPEAQSQISGITLANPPASIIPTSWSVVFE